MAKMIVELYYADWCEHCTNFKPVWKKFKNSVDDQIKCIEYKESVDDDIIKLNNISGFPTIRIIKDGKIEDYGNKKRDYDTFYNYIISKLDESPDNASNDSSVKITLYSADWCKFCKLFKPTWEKLKEAIDELPNNKKIKYAEYESNNKEVMEKENITGFPTIKITHNGETTICSDREFKLLLTNLMKKAGYSSNDIRNFISKYENIQLGGKKNKKQIEKSFYDKYIKYKATYLKLKKEKYT